MDEGARAGGRTRAWGLGFAVVSSISFGASGPFGKALISAGFSPLQAVWLRIAGAALVLVPLVLVLRGRSRLRALRPYWPQLTVYGITAATLVHLYRGGPAEDLHMALGGASSETP